MKYLKFWYFAGIFIFVVGLAGSVWTFGKTDSSVVVILQDGKVLYQLDLSDYKEPETLEIAYGNRKNTVLIENGRICISSADCPDQTCVNMGYLQSQSLPIVCLPHHLVIQYTDNHADGIDGVAD